MCKKLKLLERLVRKHINTHIFFRYNKYIILSILNNIVSIYFIRHILYETYLKDFNICIYKYLYTFVLI